MTATVEETTEKSAGGVGRIARVIGPVVDVEFPVDAMPDMYNKLETEFELSGDKHTLSLEVAQHTLAHDPGRISHLFDEALRIIFELKHHLGF